MLESGEMNGQACRYLVIAVMLRACLDAQAGDAEAMEWIYSDGAAHLAELTDYEHLWPPARDQLAPKKQLTARAREFGIGAPAAIYAV